MYGRIAMVLIALAAAGLLLSARAARAQDDLGITSAPAPALGAGPPGEPQTAPTLQDLAGGARDMSRLAAVLSGLALIGVLWVGWSQRDLARNQVQLAALIQKAREMEE